MNNSEQDFKCVFCEETFPQKDELQVHFRKHADPNFNQKKTRVRAQNETDESAEKPKDQVEMVECDVCPETFTSISKAITHKHKVHPDHDKKYFCPWCGKLFTMKHLYNKHVHAAHSDINSSEDELFHCDSCDFNFVHTAIVYHNKFYHRQDELPIIGYSKKFKMIGLDMVQIFYCPFCGEEFDNKVNLHKHMTDDHSDENQRPEEVLRCPLCDAIFYHLDAYEVHLTYHSVEDFYTERSELMDEINDFSLEMVQPQREKVENTESLSKVEPKVVGIEQLLEFTMDDDTARTDNRKSKKHKKHKKSKKSAITLDEFLNMNKHVFGEGIDIQGIEEVPSQVIAKRLKPKKQNTKVMTSDIAKLKRQGIVVKKQPLQVDKSVESNRGMSNPVTKTRPGPQPKLSNLSSTSDVLSKLLNQGSQIKIMKKTQQDNEEHRQLKEADVDKKSFIEEENDQCNYPISDVSIKAELRKGDDIEKDRDDNSKSDDVEPMTQRVPDKNSPPEKPITAYYDNSISKPLQDSDTISNNSIKTIINERSDKSQGCFDKISNFEDSLNVLRNNSNIAIKKPKQKISEDPVENPKRLDSDDEVGENQTNIPDTHEEKQLNDGVSNKSCLDAFKHLSHLITIKPVNQTQHSTSSDNNKHESGLQNIGTTKTSDLAQSNSSKADDGMNISNLKKLGDITKKSGLNTTKLSKSENAMADVEADENFGADEEWEELSTENRNNVDKIAHVLKNPQLSINKQLTTSKEKESPKLTSNDPSSVNLKHLKNLSINVNSQKIQTPKSSPVTLKKGTPNNSLQKEITEEGIEIFSIEDSDSDEGHCDKNKIPNIRNITDSKIKGNNEVLKNVKINKNITMKSIKSERQANPPIKEEPKDSADDFDRMDTSNKLNSPKPNQVMINNVLKNLSKNITVKSRNSSPSQTMQSQNNNSRDSEIEANDASSDSEPRSPSNKVKITEIENTSDNEFTEEPAENISLENVKVEYPDDSHSDPEGAFLDEDFEDMQDFESQIKCSSVHKVNDTSRPNASFNILKNTSKDLTVKTSQSKPPLNKSESSLTSEDIPEFAKNLSSQISVKQIKKPENKTIKQTEQMSTHSTNQSMINQKIASSNQVNLLNKEVKTVKTFHTQTKTVIQEITTTVTKTIKTVNQTSKQEIRNMGQSSSTTMLPQKIQGVNPNCIQKNFQGVKVRQSAPNVRPRFRGPAPQGMRPAICAPPQMTRPAAVCGPVRASNQLVPVRPNLNRPSGPRPRLPNAINVRATPIGQQRPQGKPVKISPGAIFSSPKRPAEASGHFSCFKKPKESLIPEADFPSSLHKNDTESTQFSSAVQMSRSNFSCTTKTVKGNSVLTSTKMSSETSASSQQLSKLQNMSGLSIVKTSQSKQAQVEEHSEISASKRNTLEAIQKLQSQGLLVKKPRLDVNEDSDHSQPGSDDLEHACNEEFDED